MIPAAIALSALALVLIGLFGIITAKPLFKTLLAYKVVEIGAALFIVSLSGVGRGGENHHLAEPRLETMAAVFIVLSLGFTSLVLALIIKDRRRRGPS